MAKRKPAPVFHGRKMRCVDRHAGGAVFDLKRGPVLFQVRVNTGVVHEKGIKAELFIDGITFDMKPARSLKGALQALDRMRLRLVKALEV